jgi:hypothetical protein
MFESLPLVLVVTSLGLYRHSCASNMIFHLPIVCGDSINYTSICIEVLIARHKTERFHQNSDS